jgi:hypothetical protein
MVAVGLLCFLVIENPPLSVGLGFSKMGVRKAEFYPLSSFPMYSVFSPNPIYVYLADGEGNPVASQRVFNVRTSVLKKAYDKELRALNAKIGKDIGDMTAADKRAAGDALLQLLRESLAPAAFEGGRYPDLRFYEVTITLEDGKVKESPALVGEWSEEGKGGAR